MTTEELAGRSQNPWGLCGTQPISSMDFFEINYVTEWMWELDHKEVWVMKNWHFRTVVLEKPLENLLDGKEIKALNPKWNQSWIFIERTDAKAETPILWPPDVKSQLTGEDPDAGKDWRWEKGTAEDEVASSTQWT